MNETATRLLQPNLKSYARLIIMTIIMLVTCSTMLIGATVYIDPTNTASNQNGSITNPYNSWTKVTFTNGNTYLQKSGTTFTTNSGISFSGKSNITLGAYNTGNKPKIVATGSGNHIINIATSSNIKVEDLEITSTGTWVSGVYFNGSGSSNNQIDNCKIHNTEWGVRVITTASGTKILNSTINNIGDDGIYVKDAASIEIGHCNIYDINKKYLINPDQSYSAGDGIQLASTNNMYFNIHNNTIDHSSMGNKFCIIAWGNNYSGIIENNIIIGNANQVCSGIYLSPTNKTVTVRYNVIRNSNYGIYSYAQTLDAYYNTFSENKIGISILTGYSLNARNNVFYNHQNMAVNSTPNTSVTLKNNIFNLNSGSSKAIQTNGTISSNNNIFNTQQSGFINGHATLLSWKNASGNDANSLVGNPGFVSPAGGDFHIQNSSIAINKGANVNLTHDQFGGSVPQSGIADIGIHEFAGGSGSGNQAPIINAQSFSIVQSATNGTVVGTVSASDPNAGQTLSYSIISGNTNSVFSINSSNGRITVAKPLPLQNFNLTVKVTDNGSPIMSSQAIVTITVTAGSGNQAPIINNQTFTAAQNLSIGSFVGKVVASDPNAGQTLTYSIVSGNSNSTFAINSSSGNITVAKTLPIQAFNLIVKVADNGSPAMSSQATVTITVTSGSGSGNQAPIISNQSFTALQSLSIGSFVGKVIATDPNAEQTLVYSIVSGNSNSTFAINSSNGNITVAKSLPLQTFNLIVKVTDNGSPVLSSQATVTITVTSASGNQPPYLPASTFTVREFAPNGTFVGKLNATDPNPGQKLTYLIISGNINNAFTLNRTNGAINVKNRSALNMNVITTFHLSVRVTDNGQPNMSFTQIITVNVVKNKAGDEMADDDSMEFIEEPKEMRVYPNPSVDGKFSVAFGKQYDNVNVEVFDLSGRLISKTTVTQASKEIINLSTNPNGAYLIRIDTGEEQKTLKAIKQ